MRGRRSLRDTSPRGASSRTTPRRDISPGTPSGFPCSRIRACSDRLHDPSPSRPPILRMHQPFIHMMQRSGDRNSCGYAGGPQPLYAICLSGEIRHLEGACCHIRYLLPRGSRRGDPAPYDALCSTAGSLPSKESCQIDRSSASRGRASQTSTGHARSVPSSTAASCLALQMAQRSW